MDILEEMNKFLERYQEEIENNYEQTNPKYWDQDWLKNSQQTKVQNQITKCGKSFIGEAATAFHKTIFYDEN